MEAPTPTQKRSLGRRMWDRLDKWLPTLTDSEQAAVYMDMRRNARANVDFYVLIILASTIAYYGLLQNSAAVIIGAMLVAPLMSPMIAMAHAIVMGNLTMLRRALLSTLAGIGIAVALAAIFTILLPSIPPQSEILNRTHPTLLDLFVALASGAAAAYALARKDVAAALPGVAIAAALVPPLCVVGYGLGSFRSEIAYGASLLFLTNLASIILAGAAMFMLLGFKPTSDIRIGNVQRGLAIASIGLLIVFVPLAVSTIAISRQTQRQSAVETILLEQLSEEIVEIEDINIQQSSSEFVVSFTAYMYGRESDENVLNLIRTELSEAVRAPVTLRVRVVPSILAEVDESGIRASSAFEE